MLEGMGPKMLLVFVVGLTVVLIGVGISTDVFSIQNSDKSLVIRTVGDVTVTPEKFIGQRITVRGYYYHGDLPSRYGYITSAPVEQPIIEESLNTIDFLIMNFSSFNVTFGEGVLYYFTGILLSSQDTMYHGTSYVLSLKAIEQP
jgi:hypothetical protein